MSRSEYVLREDLQRAAVELLTGAVVVSGQGTPEETYAWREDVPRCGTVYLVRKTDGHETVAWDAPEKAIVDLVRRAAEAPKPDELTVDDVLGVLDHEYVAVHLGHNWWVRRGSGAYELAVDCIGNEPVFVGAFVDCWREAKRRGLLG